MAKTYKLTDADVPTCRTLSGYADVVTDFLKQGKESMQVEIEGVKPETLRAGLRKAIKDRGDKDVRLAQRGVKTYCARPSAD